MDVNAKDLFRKKITEAESAEDLPRPQGPSGAHVGLPPRRPMPPSRRRGGEMEPEMGDMERVLGHAHADMPKGQFSPKELNQVKDVVILILASLLGSDLDKQIGTALASGQPLDPGQLQHILDEARRADIPESHGPVMQKIFQLSQQA